MANKKIPTKKKGDPPIQRAAIAALISFVYMLVRLSWKKSYLTSTGKTKLSLTDQALINGFTSATMTPVRRNIRKFFRYKKLPHI